MSKYRKIPIIVDAVQWFKDGDHISVKKIGYASPIYGVDTPHGFVAVESGDWIITGDAGGVYVCKRDIFELTYEPCDQLFAFRAVSDLGII